MFQQKSEYKEIKLKNQKRDKNMQACLSKTVDAAVFKV